MSYLYVNMKYKMSPKKEIIIKDELVFKSIKSTDKDHLYNIFVECFNNGDAKFYENLEESQKREFFESELGFPKVLEQEESHIVLLEDEIVGYTLAMQYGKANVQISCMCVLPKYQNKGIGEAMLSKVEQVAKSRDMKTLSLGTEDTMKAYKLYSKFGFKVTRSYEME